MVPESDPCLSSLNEQILSIKEEVEKLSKERSVWAASLKEVADKRTEVFLKFLDAATKELKEIYKKVTGKDQNMNQGGTVELFIDDKLNPFEKTIHFYPCPPGKRAVYDITQLSGGEKTVASLSLLFAFAQVKCPPLILLDEVDAFLDAQNVGLITDFIRDELKCQTLMVSHKEHVVKNAMSLVGASFIKAQKTSKAFSLDLRNYSQ